MKYSELISFKPIESTIQLLETAEKSAARDAVSTYVMSDSMAEGMQAPVIEQLQMEEVVDNKAIMVVGNFGTGKSHLMSVIAAVATDKENLQYLQNKNFAHSMEIIAGKFEVLRMKVDGLTMPLREIIMGEIEDDFANRGIEYTAPDLASVRDNSRIIKDVMTKFQEKYPDKGYLIVIDELLSYLTSRDERQIVLDLAFLQSMAEIDKIKELSPQGVLNFSDLFDTNLTYECFDKRFQISYMYTPIIFLSMVYAGYAVITLKNGTTITDTFGSVVFKHSVALALGWLPFSAQRNRSLRLLSTQTIIVTRSEN